MCGDAPTSLLAAIWSFFSIVCDLKCSSSTEKCQATWHDASEGFGHCGRSEAKSSSSASQSKKKVAQWLSKQSRLFSVLLLQGVDDSGITCKCGVFSAIINSSSPERICEAPCMAAVTQLHHGMWRSRSAASGKGRAALGLVGFSNQSSLCMRNIKHRIGRREDDRQQRFCFGRQEDLRRYLRISDFKPHRAEMKFGSSMDFLAIPRSCFDLALPHHQPNPCVPLTSPRKARDML